MLANRLLLVMVVRVAMCRDGWEVVLKGREMRVFLTRLLLAAAGMVCVVYAEMD